MNNRMGDLSWRMKGSRPMWLLLVPVFFFFALLFMGRKAKFDGFTKLGWFFGVISLLSFAVGMMGLVLPVLFYVLIAQVVCWVMCAMQTLRLRQKYLQHLEWAEEDEEKERDPMVFEKKWRRVNGLWCFWSCIPLLGGLGTFFMGRRIDNRYLKWSGLGSVALVLVLFVYTMVSTQVNGVVGVFALLVAYASICVHPMLAAFYFEEYLDATAEMWKDDFAEYPIMEKRSWRVKNSLWQILTCVPYISTFGLFFVGIHRENSKVLWGASALCVAEMACVVGPSVLMGNETLQAWTVADRLGYTVGLLWFFVYILIAFFGVAIRWDMLRCRAQALRAQEEEYE